jgi:hypothetical protein
MTDDQQYIWMDSYRAALLETDLAKLKLLLPAAETLMQQREHELLLNPSADRAELRALEDANRNLRVLKRELQKGEEK